MRALFGVRLGPLCGGWLLLCGMTMAAPPAQGGPERVLWRDDFTSRRGYERSPAYAWVSDGRFRASDGMAMLTPTVAPLRHGSISAELTLSKRTGTSWTWAGIAFYSEPGNSWQLLLVEAADGTRYMELLEELDGVRQAQSAPNAATALRVEETGALHTWQPGHRYALRLSLTADGVEGVIRDPAGGGEWRRTYHFDGRRAVRKGRPTVMASGFEGRLHNLIVTSSDDSSTSPLAIRKGKPGSVVVLRSRTGSAGEKIGAALSRAGFGVTLVGWDDLVSKRLPQGQFDLFVLADARSLSVQARDEVVRTLCSGGKVMAIGAPAGSEVLARTPRGWRDRDGWLQDRAQRLRREALHVPPGGWVRNAYRPSQPASISLDPTQGADCWKITGDLAGWDGWYADVGRAFEDERTLLVFEARGDATTTDLAVECVEKDGSRWIATIPLRTEWRWYVLNPADFAFWPDSPAKNRGFPGDRFRPANAARFNFTLSGSHTPRVKPGLHTYWVRNISTAREETSEQPDFRMTDIEGLWPSYKLYAMDSVAYLQASSEQGVVRGEGRIPWKRAACSPVWRERGRGIHRGRAWRWIPILEAFDAAGRKRGSVVSLMVGNASWPNAIWANVSVADPAHALSPEILPTIVATAKAMVRGVFLLDGGAEFFSYKRGEPVVLGATVANMGRSRHETTAAILIHDVRGAVVYRTRRALTLPSGGSAETSWTWLPENLAPQGYTVTTSLYEAGALMDRIEHRIEALRTEPARPDEFVRVQGSMFTLGGKPWYFRGINYWPNWIAGYPTLNHRNRECYDPEIIERDLAWLQSAGVNVVSAIAGIQPPNPDDPAGYRDQLDFLDRCLRHGIRCYFTVPYGRAYAGADFARIKDYIEKAGLRDHPAIMCWELAWEPIEGAWNKDLEKLGPDWNRWLVERYGSVEHALSDWGFDPRPSPEKPVPAPTMEQCMNSGPWNRYVAAFTRAFSDLISRAYGKVIRPLRAWDPSHLISFRGGACGIPSGAVFAHIHSVGVARHLDFLCPEGYNLQTGGWAVPTPADDIRKGGLVTLYYRHVSREKPVVWLEFGFTVNGFGEAWTPARFRVRPAELENQRIEVEHFYSMFVESGSRGASPWWFPGGFRLGENSDFGFVEPDGSERPVCSVFKAYQPRFAGVRHDPPDSFVTLDLEGERYRAWQMYAPAYLDLVKAGKIPAVRTEGTGTDSSNCPLVSVTGTPCDGHNPPRHLNAEFDRLEIKVGDEPWREATDGAAIVGPKGARVLCRAVVGNIGEAKWLAAGAGAVRLTGRAEYGLAFSAPVTADVPYLGSGEVAEFTLVPGLDGEVRVSFEMEAAGRTWFGERRVITLRPQP